MSELSELSEHCRSTVGQTVGQQLSVIVGAVGAFRQVRRSCLSEPVGGASGAVRSAANAADRGFFEPQACQTSHITTPDPEATPLRLLRALTLVSSYSRHLGGMQISPRKRRLSVWNVRCA